MGSSSSVVNRSSSSVAKKVAAVAMVTKNKKLEEPSTASFSQSIDDNTVRVISSEKKYKRLTFEQFLKENREIVPFIRLINFKNFVNLGTFPRYPDNKDLTITLDQLTTEAYESSLLVFISHCWLRGWSGAEGWDGRPHPDSAKGGKYTLCVEGIEQIRKTMAPGMKECYIWLDYGCIDQDGNPGGELKLLDKTIQVCDCLFSPLFDQEHKSKEYYARSWTNVLREYESQSWNGSKSSYLNRGWCRVEMFYAANIPLLEDSESRLSRMAAGLKLQKEEGRRPHVMFGSGERAARIPPIVLPPLQNSYFEEFHPEKGHLTKETDREIIKRLVQDLQPYMKKVKVGYDGDEKGGTRNGKGVYRYPNGDVYEGEYKDGKRHGHGIYREADGCIYEGEYKNGVKHGKGIYRYAHGEEYDGQWKDGNMHGYGVYKYADGGVYEGHRENDLRHGRGIYRYADGSVYEGEYRNDERHGNGAFHEADGGLYEGEWKEGKKEGKGKWRYSNGNVYEGEFMKGQRHGKGVMTYANGEISRGEWKEDRKCP